MSEVKKWTREVVRLVAEVRDLKRRIRLARKALRNVWIGQSPNLNYAIDLLDLRKPLKRGGR